MKLYYVPRTRAGRPRWLLEELGVPYELVRVDVAGGQNKTTEYLALHPQGHVPVLVDEGLTLFESAAICMYLADKFPERGLAPPLNAPARAHHYQWILFAVTELEPGVSTYSKQTTTLPVAERVPSLAERARGQVGSALTVLEARLADRPFLLGAELTTADVVVGAVLAWARALGLLEGHAVADAYVQRLIARPAYVRARAD